MTGPDAWHPAGSRDLRIGLAGLGMMGRNHLRILSGHAGVELVAVADPVAATLAAAVAQTGARATRPPRR